MLKTNILQELLLKQKVSHESTLDTNQKRAQIHQNQVHVFHTRIGQLENQLQNATDYQDQVNNENLKLESQLNDFEE